MILKPGVKLSKLTPQMALAASVVHAVYAKHGADCVITSCNDGKHSDASLHYEGNALDFRTKNYSGNKKQLRDEIAQRLGDEFDVLLEDEGGENEHIHAEWDI